MSTNINSTEQIVEINAGDQITNVNIVSQSTTQVISGEQVVTVDVNAGTIPAAWGSITGTLSNQTDLQNALNAKQNNITLTTTGTTGVATLVGATLNIPNYVSSTKQTQWDSAYNDKINSAEVSGTTTKTLTLTQQDGGIIQASWSDFDTAPVTSVFGRTGDVVATEGDYNINQLGDVTITSATNGQVLKYNGTAWVNAADASGLTSVGLAMPSAFAVSGSPLTSNGTITVTGAGTTAQYVRGDGSLATFPTTSNEAKTLIREVYNKTGATLTKGTVIYINGGQGNLPTVTKAIATGDPTSAQTFGIVQSDITNMNNGFVVVAGGIDNLDTQAYTEGTALYLSPTTAGAWTSTKPYAPNHMVYLGVVVRSHPTQGVIEVKIQNGVELDEIHNVSARFPVNKDGLFYNSTSGVWENKSIAGVLGYTPVPESRIITINGTAQNLSADRTWNVGTVTSVAASGGTGISISGSPVTGSGTINITNTAPDQIVSLTGAGTTSISGTYPNFTVTSNDQYVGTVTSVNATVPTGFEVSGVPITSSGTIDIKFTAGYSLPTTAKQTQWDDAYAKRIDSLTVTGNSGSSTLISNVLNVPTYTLAGLGGEPAITAGTTSQYWRGDKSFQTLDTSVVPENGNVYFTEPRVRATVLSGLNITGGSISASDSVLNAFGKVQNQINGLIGGSIFQSTWNASTNTPSLASGVGTKGYYYIVSVAGTTNLDGITDWQIGDWAIFDGTVWRKVDNTDAVVSVNGYTGVVNLVLDDLADVSAASPTDTQLLRFNGTTSKWYNWTPTYISGNQTITLSGDVTGSGTTAITTSIGIGKVTNAMLAGSINYSKMDATTVPTWNQDTTGTSAALATKDNRTISPSEDSAGQLKFGFTSYANDNNSPWADYLHLRSYNDNTGGNDNLLVFNKSSIAMRLYQQTFGSATAYSSYRDIAFTDSDITGNAATANKWKTARTLTIGSTGKSVDGSGNVSWSLAEIGAQAILTNPVTGTGTINYVAKFNATGSTIGDSQIFDNGTNVGIGTASTSTKLTIEANNPTRGIITTIRNSATSSHTGAQIHFVQNNVADWVIGQGAAATSFSFWVDRYPSADGVEKFRLYQNGSADLYPSSSGGGLTIGTSTTAYALGLYFKNDVNTSGNFIGLVRTSNQFISGTAAGDFVIGLDSSKNLIIGDGPASTIGVKITSAGAATFTGTISASNFSGSSSGTNTGDQTITLTGDVTGSGTGSFATTIGAAKVTNSMLAGSINYSKMDASTVPTWNQDTTGVATTAIYIRSQDTRNTASTPETNGASQGIRFDFKANSTNGLSDGGTYNGVMYFRKYGTGTDWTGGGAHEIGFTDSGNIYHRYGSSTTWGSWVKFWDSGNDGTGSGLDADLLDGQHGSYYAAASSLSSYLPLSGGTLTGSLSGTSATFSGGVTFGANNRGFVREPSGDVEIGGTAGAALKLYANNAEYAKLSTSTGFSTTLAFSGTSATFSSSVTSNGFAFLNNIYIESRNTFASSNDYPRIFTSDGGSGGIRSGEFGHIFIQSRSSTTRDIGFITGSTPVERMTIKGSTGRIGIGTISPGARLEVNETNPTRGIILNLTNDASSSHTGVQVKFTQNGIMDWVIGQPAGSTSFSFWTDRYASADGTERLRLTNTGDILLTNVGSAIPIIRATSSTGALNLFAGASADYNGGAGITLVASDRNGQYTRGEIYISAGRSTNNSTYGYIWFGTSDTQRMLINQSGVVFISNSSGTNAALQASERLNVNGTVYATAYYETSDIRLKNVKNTFESNDINAIIYYWNDKKDDKLHIGYSAQQVQKYIPDAVMIGKDGTLSLDYNQVHTWKIAQLESEIKQLKNKLNELGR